MEPGRLRVAGSSTVLPADNCHGQWFCIKISDFKIEFSNLHFWQHSILVTCLPPKKQDFLSISMIELKSVIYLFRYSFYVALSRAETATQFDIAVKFIIVHLFNYLAKLIASKGSWTSSNSKCLCAIDCILIRLCLVACCSVIMSWIGSSPWRKRDCTDSRNKVYKLFLSASESESKTRSPLYAFNFNQNNNEKNGMLSYLCFLHFGCLSTT